MTTIDDYEKRNNDQGYWEKSSDFFYASLEQQWRDEGASYSFFPDEIYQNQGLLLNFVSQNRFDWFHYMDMSRFTNAKIDSLRPQFVDPVKAWVDAMANEVTNLAFVGPNGGGKTHSAFAACRFMTLHGVLRRKDDLYMPTSRVLQCVDAHNILDGWSKTQDAASMVDVFKNVPLLLLDDLGAVSTTAQAALANVGSILSHRYNLNLPTVVTSNQGTGELSKMFGSTTIRRIFNDNTIVCES